MSCIDTQKQITLNEKNITYIHRISTRSKVMRLAVYRDGLCVLTTPPYIHESLVLDFMVKKLNWIIEKTEYFKSKPQQTVVQHTVNEIKEYTKQAEILVSQRLEYFNRVYGYPYRKITIKNMTSRWGSCSSKGNLNFNYKIALLPSNLADYIVVHELCHRKEMNHSVRFWNLVEKTMPNHKELRKQLRRFI